jgi:hypothetical protein
LIAFSCIASAVFEVFFKTNYRNPNYLFITDGYMNLWPSLWTPCEALRMQKVLLPLLLSVVLFLMEIISTQDELIKRGLAILEKVRIEIKSRKEVSEADERLKEVPCRDDIAQM